MSYQNFIECCILLHCLKLVIFPFQFQVKDVRIAYYHLDFKHDKLKVKLDSSNDKFVGFSPLTFRMASSAAAAGVPLIDPIPEPPVPLPEADVAQVKHIVVKKKFYNPSF